MYKYKVWFYLNGSGKVNTFVYAQYFYEALPVPRFYWASGTNFLMIAISLLVVLLVRRKSFHK